MSKQNLSIVKHGRQYVAPGYKCYSRETVLTRKKLAEWSSKYDLGLSYSKLGRLDAEGTGPPSFYLPGSATQRYRIGLVYDWLDEQAGITPEGDPPKELTETADMLEGLDPKPPAEEESKVAPKDDAPPKKKRRPPRKMPPVEQRKPVLKDEVWVRLKDDQVALVVNEPELHGEVRVLHETGVHGTSKYDTFHIHFRPNHGDKEIFTSMLNRVKGLK